jgi:hypothetical protein
MQTLACDINICICLLIITCPLYCFHQFIFRKDLKRRPSFTKLKTLLLNEWCVAANFAALVYFLQHSPILEKLTIELDKVEIYFLI